MRDRIITLLSREVAAELAKFSVLQYYVSTEGNRRVAAPLGGGGVERTSANTDRLVALGDSHAAVGCCGSPGFL